MDEDFRHQTSNLKLAKQDEVPIDKAADIWSRAERNLFTGVSGIYSRNYLSLGLSFLIRFLVIRRLTRRALNLQRFQHFDPRAQQIIQIAGVVSHIDRY